MASKSNKLRLTEANVLTLECAQGKTQSFYGDETLRGLFVRVTANGARSYVFEGSIKNKSVRITIGSVKDWTLKKAQAQVRVYQTQIDQGLDPRIAIAEQVAKTTAKQDAIKAAKIADEQKRTTFAQAWAAYIDANTQRWGELHKRDHANVIQSAGVVNGRSRVEGPLRPLMGLPLDCIDDDAVKAWLASEAKLKRPTQTALAYRLFRAFYNWCAESKEYRQLVSEGLFRRRELQRLVPKKNTKNDILELSQLPAWFDAVRRISSPVISAYLQILALTGARRGELAGLEWANVDWKWRTIRIADKVEQSRVIPLTPYVESLLLALKHSNDTPPGAFRISGGKRISNDLPNWKPSPWVFSSKTSKSGRLICPSNAHRKAAKEAGVGHITLHGLRRTFATHSENTQLSVPAGVVAQIMGHKPSATAERHYIRRPLDTLREWHTEVERFFLSEAGVQFDYTTPQKAKTLRLIESQK